MLMDPERLGASAMSRPDVAGHRQPELSDASP
jgi:hypothetical protein